MTEIKFAFDRSVRTLDENGHLHIAVANISKSNICPYYGRELPDAGKLNLDPDKVYNLLRDPDELAKAVDSFKGIPILDGHIPVSADDSHRDRIVGSVGTDVRFEAPYLKASLTFWDGDAIKNIESGKTRQLSCGYRFQALMEPGEYEGVHYDGRMVSLAGNHLALVAVGRAGADVVVGDAELNAETRDNLEESQFAVPGKRKLPIHDAKHAKLAWDLLSDTDGLTPEEKTEARKRILAAAKKFDVDTSTWQGAQDSAPDLKGKPMTVKKRAALDTVIAKLKPFLAADADIEKVKAACDDFPDDVDAEDEDETEEEKKAREAKEKSDADKKAKDDAEEEAKRRAEADKSKEDDKKAMDAAIAEGVKAATNATIARLNAVREAEKIVRPFIGELAIAQDSADAVYRLALDHLKVDHKAIKETSALKALVEVHPVPGARREAPRIAQDSAASDAYAKRFPSANRLAR